MTETPIAISEINSLEDGHRVREAGARSDRNLNRMSVSVVEPHRFEPAVLADEAVWITAAIERSVVSAVSPDLVRDDEQIVRTSEDGQIHRLIVTPRFEFYDGSAMVVRADGRRPQPNQYQVVAGTSSLGGRDRCRCRIQCSRFGSRADDPKGSLRSSGL